MSWWDRHSDILTAMHVGKLIQTYLSKEPKEHTVTWFARQLNCHRVNAYDIFRRRTIDTELLSRISVILNHNFFIDLANEFDNSAEPRQKSDNEVV
jgi:hypothetical protein